MDRNQLLSETVPAAAKAIIDSILSEPRTRHLDRVYLPSRAEIIGMTERLRQILFPGYFGRPGLSTENLPSRLSELLNELTSRIYEQVRCCLCYRLQIPVGAQNGVGHQCDDEAAVLVKDFRRVCPRCAPYWRRMSRPRLTATPLPPAPMKPFSATPAWWPSACSGWPMSSICSSFLFCRGL